MRRSDSACRWPKSRVAAVSSLNWLTSEGPPSKQTPPGQVQSVVRETVTEKARKDAFEARNVSAKLEEAPDEAK